MQTLSTSRVGRCATQVSRTISGSRTLVPAEPESQSSFDSEALQKKAAETFSGASAALKERWDNTEDKAGAVVVLSASVVGLITMVAIVEAIDKIPLLSDAVELVGVGVTGWFIYRYMIYGPDREELMSNVKDFIKKIGA